MVCNLEILYYYMKANEKKMQRNKKAGEGTKEEEVILSSVAAQILWPNVRSCNLWVESFYQRFNQTDDLTILQDAHAIRSKLPCHSSLPFLSTSVPPQFHVSFLGLRVPALMSSQIIDSII